MKLVPALFGLALPSVGRVPGHSALIVGSCLLVGCATAKQGQSQEEPPRGDSGAAAEKDAHAAMPTVDADAGSGGAYELPPPQPEQTCMPGHYEGMFSCVISGVLPWQGKMSFSLVQKTTEAGEFTILQIVPGTTIMGADDNLQGMFTAQLEGTFDCTTGTLKGSMAGTYLFLGLMSYELHGDLTGSYLAEGDAGVPEFQGTMGPIMSKDYEAFGSLGPSAMCTWNAARTGDPDADAGVPETNDGGM